MGLLTPGQYIKCIAAMGGDVKNATVEDYLKAVDSATAGGRLTPTERIAQIEYFRKWRESHRNEIAAYDRAYYKRNQDLVCARSAEYTATHKDSIKITKKAWRDANKDRISKINKRAYEARKQRLAADPVEKRLRTVAHREQAAKAGREARAKLALAQGRVPGRNGRPPKKVPET